MSFDSQQVSFLYAFIAGVLSFLSPCVLPLFPSYVTFITGLSLEEFNSGEGRGRVLRLTFLNSLFYIFGFSAVFIALGASATLLGQLLFDYQKIITKIGGVLIILFGLFIAGILKLDFLKREKKIHLLKKPAGYFGSFLVGATFAFAWTPCVGPILSAILLYASTKNKITEGIWLLSVYSLGLGLPFLLSSLALSTFLTHYNKFKKYYRYIMIFSGLLLIIIGILILTDHFSRLSGYLGLLPGLSGF